MLPAPVASPTPLAGKDSLGPYSTPETYVVSRFKDHDIVFLGEMHSVRQNLRFIQRLIPELYRAGIYNLAYEFAAYHDQARIDRLVNATVYDEREALELLWRCCNLKWVTQEYADTFKAVWKLNRGLTSSQPKFRLIGLDINNLDEAGNVVAGESTTNGVRDGDTLLNAFDSRNFFWAEVLDREIMRSHRKALVYSGVGHAFTKFYNQRGEDHGIAAGNLIFHAIGPRSFTINIHGSANPAGSRVALAKRVEEFVAANLPDRQAFGLDLAQTAIGNLVTDAQGNIIGQPRCSSFSLADLSDGYVYLAPLVAWEPVTFRADFITPETYPRIERRWRSDRPRDRTYTIDELRHLAQNAIGNQFLYQQGKNK